MEVVGGETMKFLGFYTDGKRKLAIFREGGCYFLKNNEEFISIPTGRRGDEIARRFLGGNGK